MNASELFTESHFLKGVVFLGASQRSERGLSLFEDLSGEGCVVEFFKGAAAGFRNKFGDERQGNNTDNGEDKEGEGDSHAGDQCWEEQRQDAVDAPTAEYRDTGANTLHSDWEDFRQPHPHCNVEEGLHGEDESYNEDHDGEWAQGIAFWKESASSRDQEVESGGQ